MPAKVFWKKLLVVTTKALLAPVPSEYIPSIQLSLRERERISGTGIFNCLIMLGAVTRISLPLCITTGTISLMLFTGWGLAISISNLEMRPAVSRPSTGTTLVKSELTKAGASGALLLSTLVAG